MNHEDELEKIESESVEALRERLNTLNRCWSDTTCDCFQQKIADRLLEHYDAVVARMRTLEGVVRSVQEDVMHLNQKVSTFGVAAAICEKIEAALAADQPTDVRQELWDSMVDAVEKAADDGTAVQDDARWLIENAEPHTRLLAIGKWDEWLNRRNAYLGWKDDRGSAGSETV